MAGVDFCRGLDAANGTGDLAAQLTTAEILSCGGPDFLGGEGSDEPPDYHHGWDAAIRAARAGVNAR